MEGEKNGGTHRKPFIANQETTTHMRPRHNQTHTIRVRGEQASALAIVLSQLLVCSQAELKLKNGLILR